MINLLISFLARENFSESSKEIGNVYGILYVHNQTTDIEVVSMCGRGVFVLRRLQSRIRSHSCLCILGKLAFK